MPAIPPLARLRKDAARQLGKTVGSVYAARSRVMRRLKQKIQEFEQDTSRE